jgi:divalent metal cation (Fe/Co/Zn/Cd) transporter
MTRDTILDYAVLLLRFLSQVGLMIGGIMIVYAGYRYILNVLEAAEPDPSLIKNAIIGIMVIIFSYAIMRILTRAFLT